MRINKSLIGTICRIIIGLVFILSAVLKYLSIEAVDLFFFDHKLFPWVITTILSRLLISLEAIIGIMLVVGVYPKLSKILTFLMLIGFTVYLLIKPLFFDVTDENCFCFGDKIQLSDKETIIKNVILLLLALTLNWAKWWRTRYSKLILIISSLLVVGTAFTIKPPDFIQSKIYKHSVNIRPEVFERVKKYENLQALEIDKGKKVVCWYSTNCKYCKRAAKKIDIIIDRHKLDRNDFIEVFGGKEKSLTKFYEESNTKPLPYTFIDIVSFLNTTHGHMPVIFLLEEGKVIQLYKLTTIDEAFIVDFFKPKNNK
ncbi:MAG: DoxX family protein [Bacteroidales bacterium]|jgi:uncharacterized membrane protein YphA (DoxX/SURF4 family)|nr:DoxX family protein [Bacteroidales bacterium]MDD4702809.1 DoxX family protein [Bacteroidales bacterium]MDX9797282.1 DoxX family protein [Bacteroidales bacterium]